jgi:hypothetical protein
LRLSIAALGLRLRIALIGRALLAISGIELDGRSDRNVRLSGWRSSRRRLRTALHLPQALLELAVAELQLLILAGELPQLILQPLDPQFRILVIRLRESL